MASSSRCDEGCGVFFPEDLDGWTEQEVLLIFGPQVAGLWKLRSNKSGQAPRKAGEP